MTLAKKYLFFLFSLSLIYLLTLLFLGKDYQLRVVVDDYFYAERIAQNCIHGLGITFDGVVKTNGFQPLWQIAITGFVALSLFFHGIDNAFFAVAFNFIFFFAGMIYLTKDWKNPNYLQISLLIVLGTLAAFFSPMALETAALFFVSCLLIPRLIASCPLNSSAAFLLFLTFVARIDSCLYFMPFLLYALLNKTIKKTSAFFILGSVLLIGFLALNQWYFGSAFPVSGLAKTVLFFSGFHSSVFFSIFSSARFNLVLILLAIQTILCIYFATQDRKFIFLSALGVILYYGLTCVRSDWVIMPWYLFPFALHAIVLTVISSKINFKADHLIWKYSLLSLSILVLLVTLTKDFKDMLFPNNAIMDRAGIIKQFLLNDPTATVAMGDQAGALGKLIPNRLIQLEGLVMDKEYLNKLKTMNDLPTLLKSYHIKYYVTAFAEEVKPGCYLVSEPHVSNGYSKKIKSIICDKLIQHQHNQKGDFFIFQFE